MVNAQMESQLPLEKEVALLFDTFAPHGSVAEIAELRKRKNYEALSAVQVFTPIAVETSGVFGPETRCILHKLASRVRSVTNKEKSYFYHLSFIKNNLLIFISHDTLLKPILIYIIQ